MRICLGLSLIACLSARASGQAGDASFAAALDQSSFIAAMAQSRESAPKPLPAPTPPPAPGTEPARAPDAVWQKIIEAVKEDGVFTPPTPRTPAVFELEDVVGDPKADYTLRSVVFAGTINTDKRFEAKGAVLIFREAKQDTQRASRRVEQWLFQTDVHGEVAFAMRAVRIEKLGGGSSPIPAERLAPADPKTKTQYESLLKYWAGRKP